MQIRLQDIMMIEQLCGKEILYSRFRIIFAVLILFFSGSFLYSYSFTVSENYYYYYCGLRVCKEGNNIAVENFEYYEIKPFDSFILMDDGWYKNTFNGVETYCIFGGDYFLAYSGQISPKGAIYDSYDRDYYNFVSKNISPHSHGGTEYFFANRVQEIESIIVPDVLTENIRGVNIVYDTYDMERFYTSDWELSEITFNANAIPWATSKDPVGMEIDINFIKPSDKIVILNGYANPQKRNLYKDNRRMKRIKITSSESDFEVIEEIEDVVHFHEISLPCAVKNLKIEILDFYEGNKYTDLCVQMFGLPIAKWESQYSAYSNLNSFPSKRRVRRYTGN